MKNIYIVPSIGVYAVNESVVLQASVPLIDGDANPDLPVGAKDMLDIATGDDLDLDVTVGE